MKNVEKMAKQLHLWYLEAIKTIPKSAYNVEAQVSYKNLSDEQKNIDRYIAVKVLEAFTGEESPRSAADN